MNAFEEILTSSDDECYDSEDECYDSDFEEESFSSPEKMLKRLEKEYDIYFDSLDERMRDLREELYTNDISEEEYEIENEKIDKMCDKNGRSINKSNKH
jgi:hypothetical protein